jgi:glycerophosphoryl diester phosphodiesterase
LRKNNIYNFKNIEYYDKLLSHRARVSFFQENTLDAFIEVLKTDIKYIEMDIRFSKDDECYLYHDSYFIDGEEVFRIADNDKQYINNIKYSNINSPITKLTDLLDAFSKNKKDGQVIAIDIKDYGYEEELYNMFEKYNILDSVIIFTWTPQTILKFDELFLS